MNAVKFLEKELLAKEVFSLIVRDCTWGNSKAGGPVWVMDFRFESLKKHFLKNSVILALLDALDENSRSVLSAKLAEMAGYYVYDHQICNVMVIKDCYKGVEVSFYSLLSFCRLLSGILGRKAVDGASLSQVSYILAKQSKAIKNDDYIWCAKWRIDTGAKLSFPDFKRRGYEISSEGDKYMFLPYAIPQFVELQNIKHQGVDGKIFECPKWRYTKGTMMVECIHDWEMYLPLVVYDLMELLSLNYFENFKLAKTGEFQYPLACYGRSGDVQSYFDEYLATVPAPEVSKLISLSWHRRFEPKPYWTMRDFPDVGCYLV